MYIYIHMYVYTFVSVCSPLAPAMAIHLSTYILIEKFARLDALIAEKCYDCMCVCV